MSITTANPRDLLTLPPGGGGDWGTYTFSDGSDVVRGRQAQHTCGRKNSVHFESRFHMSPSSSIAACSCANMRASSSKGPPSPSAPPPPPPAPSAPPQPLFRRAADNFPASSSTFDLQVTRSSSILTFQSERNRLRRVPGKLVSGTDFGQISPLVGWV